jgi:hypothetical protein
VALSNRGEALLSLVAACDAIRQNERYQKDFTKKAILTSAEMTKEVIQKALDFASQHAA